MEEDPTVFVFGEDVAEAGGPFNITRELHARFGQDRIRDTPISEATMANAAVGAALTGIRPVLEIMFMDFMTLVTDALVNQAAKARFMFGGTTTFLGTMVGSVLLLTLNDFVTRTTEHHGLSLGPTVLLFAFGLREDLLHFITDRVSGGRAGRAAGPNAALGEGVRP